MDSEPILPSRARHAMPYILAVAVFLFGVYVHYRPVEDRGPKLDPAAEIPAYQEQVARYLAQWSLPAVPAAIRARHDGLADSVRLGLISASYAYTQFYWAAEALRVPAAPAYLPAETARPSASASDHDDPEWEQCARDVVQRSRANGDSQSEAAFKATVACADKSKAVQKAIERDQGLSP